MLLLVIFSGIQKIRDPAVGKFEVSLGLVYATDNHLLANTWLALETTEDSASTDDMPGHLKVPFLCFVIFDISMKTLSSLPSIGKTQPTKILFVAYYKVYAFELVALLC